jgi:hypothetical protein
LRLTLRKETFTLNKETLQGRENHQVPDSDRGSHKPLDFEPIALANVDTMSHIFDIQKLYALLPQAAPPTSKI